MMPAVSTPTALQPSPQPSAADLEFLSELGISSSTFSPRSDPRRLRTLVIGSCVAGTLGLSALLVPFVAPGFRRVALPYLPATSTQVQAIFQFLSGYRPPLLSSATANRISADVASINPQKMQFAQRPREVHGDAEENAAWIAGKKLIDLGSGDGRLVLAAAQHGMQATGVELNWWLVVWSRFLLLKEGAALRKRADFYIRDIFKTDVSSYDVIVLFGVDGMMEPIREKLQREMRDEALFIACRFPLPQCRAVRTFGSGVDTVWVYRKSDLQ
ncbi:ATP synthase subunit C lysine N-methyltransferase-like [Paramacrobiotus metropolitanus]|uniref:ATP synthase subunit C lysine N-methyltransferase-like n=1 Tax=Paramacrobiotus metropolitanus TaxID=2943436 RepID=UPI0024465B46|nr:ATP synthase subunit C lysine N-methyltransferase-like [Paramacrobiotus metropolitanus]